MLVTTLYIWWCLYFCHYFEFHHLSDQFGHFSAHSFLIPICIEMRVATKQLERENRQNVSFFLKAELHAKSVQSWEMAKHHQTIQLWWNSNKLWFLVNARKRLWLSLIHIRLGNEWENARGNYPYGFTRHRFLKNKVCQKWGHVINTYLRKSLN